MSPQQIVGVASRLFGVWLVVLAFQAVVIARALKESGGSAGAVAPYFFAGTYMVAAALLWFFPMSIAHKLVPRTKFDEPVRLRGTMAVEVACVVLGLLVVLWRALPGLTGYISVAAFWVANGQPVQTMEAARHVDGLIAITQMVVGLLFVLKARTLAQRIIPAEAENVQRADL